MIWILAALSFAGAFVQAVSGFGYGVVMMSVLPFFFTTAQSATLADIFSIAVSAVLFIKYRKSVNYRMAIIPTALCIAFSAAAIFLGVAAPDVIMRRALGVFLVLLGIYSIFFGDRIHLKPTLFSGITMGAVAGVLKGLFALAGPPFSLYYLSCTDDKDEYMGTLSFSFTVMNIATVLMRFGAGNFLGEFWGYMPLMAAGLIVGTLLGNLLMKRLNKKAVHIITSAVCAINGLYLVLA